MLETIYLGIWNDVVAVVKFIVNWTWSFRKCAASLSSLTGWNTTVWLLHLVSSNVERLTLYPGSPFSPVSPYNTQTYSNTSAVQEIATCWFLSEIDYNCRGDVLFTVVYVCNFVCWLFICNRASLLLPLRQDGYSDRTRSATRITFWDKIGPKYISVGQKYGDVIMSSDYE